mgnify:CR=1 FL=1
MPCGLFRLITCASTAFRACLVMLQAGHNVLGFSEGHAGGLMAKASHRVALGSLLWMELWSHTVFVGGACCHECIGAVVFTHGASNVLRFRCCSVRP